VSHGARPVHLIITVIKWIRTIKKPLWQVSTGRWIGDCFVYVSSNDRLNYLVGGEVQVIQKSMSLKHEPSAEGGRGRTGTVAFRG